MRCRKLLERFKLLEMSIEDARKVLGLTPDNQDVEKAYKKMAMKHHPDRGGSEEMMKKINQAKELLDKSDVFSHGAGAFRPTYAETKKRFKEKNETLLMNFMVEFQKAVPKYQEYFERFKKFKEPVVKEHASDNATFAFDVKFKMTSDDGQTDAMFDVTVYPPEPGKLGMDNSEYTYYYTTSLLHDGRDYRMTQGKYNKQDSIKALQDPAKIFPMNKIKPILSGEKKNKMSRKSFIRELEHRFTDMKPTSEPDGYMLETKTKDQYISIRRAVISYGGRQAYWDIQAYYIKKGMSFKHDPQAKYVSIPETDKGMELTTQAIKDALDGKPWHHTDKAEIIKTAYPNNEAACFRALLIYGHLFEYENDYTFQHVDNIVSYFEKKYEDNLQGPHIISNTEFNRVFHTNTPFNKIARYTFQNDQDQELNLYVATLAARRDNSISGAVTAVISSPVTGTKLVYAVDDTSKNKSDINKLKDY